MAGDLLHQVMTAGQWTDCKGLYTWVQGEDLEALYEKYGQGGFDVEEYSGNENALFTMMEFCLYPR